ncbi:hypothetical protein C0992_001726, partial [Termitomyces sp. T32_za158]
MPLHSWMEVDEEEEHHECQLQDVHQKRYYQPALSHCQAPVATYAHVVVPDVRREVAPQTQSEMGTNVLLLHLEAAGQLVPPTASFLQDSLAIIVMEGLLDQIELMKRQRISALEQINFVAKRKLPLYKGVSREPKQAKLQQPQPVEV